MTDSPASRTAGYWLGVAFSVFACAGILAASVGAVVLINQTEPTAQTINAKRKSSALVETITVRRGTYRPKIEVLGTVQAAQEVNLRSRVSGQVVELSPGFVPGGMIRSGESLLKIDRADFENALSISRSELEQAEASLAIESGRQSLAEKELKMLQVTVDAANRALVLREPQIASIRAEVKAAEAAVERAQLDLDRTRIVAPFDAQVLTRAVHIGSQVGTGDDLGRLVGIDEYWVSAAVPVRSLRWIEFASAEGEQTGGTNSTLDDSAQPGSPATLHNVDAWGAGAERCGTVARMIGALDAQTRLARVLITVADPLAMTSKAPPLILGSLINVEIEGRPIEDVVRLPRDFLRDRDTVWVMRQNELQIRQADVVFRDARFVYVRDGLDHGDEVITTTLATVADGVALRKVDEETDGDDAEVVD